MEEPSAAMSLSDLQTVWVALLVAQDHMKVPAGFQPDDDPALKVNQARSIIEEAMSTAGGDGFQEL